MGPKSQELAVSRTSLACINTACSPVQIDRDCLDHHMIVHEEASVTEIKTPPHSVNHLEILAYRQWQQDFWRTCTNKNLGRDMTGFLRILWHICGSAEGVLGFLPTVLTLASKPLCILPASCAKFRVCSTDEVILKTKIVFSSTTAPLYGHFHKSLHSSVSPITMSFLLIWTVGHTALVWCSATWTSLQSCLRALLE